MKKKSCFWMVYKSSSKKIRKEMIRQEFWWWVMQHMPRVYRLCEKHLRHDTLPF